MNRLMKIKAAAIIAMFVFSNSAQAAVQVKYHTAKVDGVGVFYREAGSKERPTVLLLPGYK